jgi:serine/threonine protein kinase
MQTFQNPNLFLSDRELVSCTCPKDQQGQPKVQSGGFALTFRLESPTKKWAVRCFHREVKDRDRRYTAISTKLNEPAIKQSGYFVDFAYQATGVTVKGQRYPIVKMSWAQGVTLGAFLESNYNNPQRLKNLQNSLKQLYRFLTANHIAHGDIQPGNIMVSDEGRKLQLIDYDGMFVPGMEGLNAAETGVPNFQHPSRQRQCPWNDRLDRFPFIMLDIALSVLEEKPSYWTKTNSSDEKVLFETTDYIAPYGSQTFNELKADAKFSKQIAILQQICLSDFDDIPDATDYILFKPSATTQKKAQQPQTISISYQGNYTVLDATNVGQIATHVGDVVEIIGRIIDTKDGWTRGSGRHGNRPYMFVNFKPWRSRVDTFRLVLWSEVLDQFAQMGVHSVSGRITGQYISIVGMVHVYTNQYGTTYQLVPSSAKQIQIIDRTEADFRLGKIKKQLKQNFGGTVSAPASQAATGSNVARLNSVVGGRTTPRIPAQRPTRVPVPSSTRTQSSPPVSAASSNADKLKSLQGQWGGGTSPVGSKVSNATSSTTSTYRSSSSTASGTTSTSSSGSGSSGCLSIIIIAVIIGVLVKCFGG